METPDPVKLASYKKSPGQGPKVLFFSGGSALRGLSRQLIHYTYNSIHIITSFDSGGSSAILREAFAMPAVGDARARLMDLADQSLQGNREIFDLFAYRFAQKAENAALVNELGQMISGRHKLVARIPDPMQEIIRHHLLWFQRSMEDGFDLRGASVGNLVLTAGYLENRRDLDPVIDVFSQLVMVRGTVQPVINKYLHLVAELEDGSTVVGQHLMTGKEVKPITSKVKRIYITEDRETHPASSVKAGEKVTSLISKAELICYPMGSFYSSIIANLLVGGIGKAISKNGSPKVYVPSTGLDPECLGHTIMDQVETLIAYASQGQPEIKATDVLSYIVIDQINGQYVGKLDRKRLAQLNIEVIDCELVSRKSTPNIDENLLLPVLLSLA
jgi:CofD-related protein of GAK system